MAELLKLFSNFESRLTKLDQPNPKLLVLFSGVPGSGKTRIAVEIEKRYAGIRISSGEINSYLYEQNIQIQNPERNELVREFQLFILEQIKNRANKLIILDSSIDRKFRIVLDWAAKNNWPVFIIQLIIDESVLIERNKQRSTENFLPFISDWIKDQTEFTAHIKPDLVLHNDYDLSEVFRIVDSKLRH